MKFLFAVVVLAATATAVIWWLWSTFPTPKETTEPITIYVTPNGSDWRWRDGQSLETSVHSVAAALRRVPPVVKHDIKINCQPDIDDGRSPDIDDGRSAR